MNRTCRVWLTESSPAPVTNDESSVVIGMSGEPAQPTFERGLVRSVALVRVPARRTLARGVPSVHENDRDAGERRLVGDELTQLTERPRVKHRSLLPRSPDPSANPPKFFESDRAFRAFGIGNDAFRNDVICVSGEQALTTGESLGSALRGPRALRGKLRAKAAATVADATERGAGVAHPFGVCGDVRNPEVNANYSFGARVRSLNGCRENEVEIATRDLQLALSVTVRKPSDINVAGNERHGDVTGSIRYPDDPCIQRDAEFLLVEFDSTRGLDGVARIARDGVGRGSFSDGAACRVRPQRKALSRTSIDQVVQIEASEGLREPSLGRDPVCAFVYVADEGKQPLSRIRIGEQFQPDGDLLHGYENRKVA